MLRLPQCAGLIASAASNDKHRYAIGNVRVSARNGIWRVDATDGRILAVLRGETEDVAAQEPFLIPAKEFKEGCKGKGDIEITLSEDGVIEMRSGSKIQTALQGEGRFPPVDDVLPRSGPVISVAIDPAILVRLLQAAMAGTDDETRRVNLHIYAPDKPIGITARTEKVCFDGVIMPLT